jgi:hypothetical protein
MDGPGAEGDGSSQVSLSDVDSDSTCTQQQASGAHLSRTARHTQRRWLAGCALTLLLQASNGHSHYYTVLYCTKNSTNHSCCCTGWVHEYLIQHLPAAAIAHTLAKCSNPRAPPKSIHIMPPVSTAASSGTHACLHARDPRVNDCYLLLGLSTLNSLPARASGCRWAHGGER